MYTYESSLHFPILILFTFLCMLTDRCNPLAIRQDVVVSTRSSGPNNINTQQCGFTGNSDVLGIGIRIGYYAQALSVWFASYFVRKEAKGLRSVNLLFLVALFLALVWTAHAPQESYAVEVYLLLRLLFATWYVGVLDRSKFSKTKWRSSYMRVVVRESSLLGLLAYTVWFAWVGLDLLQKTPCGTFVFFAAKVNLYGKYRSAFKVFSIFALVCGTIKQLDTVAQLVRRCRDTSSEEPEYYARLQQSLLKAAYQTDNPSLDSLAGDPDNEHPLTESDLEALEAAVEVPLPKSPSIDGFDQASAENSRAASRIEGVYHSEKDLPCLEEIISADIYLQDIINLDVRDHSRWCYEITWIPLKIFLPSVHSPATLYQRTGMLFRSRRIRLSILFPLFRYIKSLERFSLYSYMFLIEAAIQSPYYQQISHDTLAVALTLHKAQLPPNRPRANVFFHAAASLSLCVLLILSIELSMHWNHIVGTGNIGAPGQLIPTVLGLGGLLRILWVWWVKTSVHKQEDDGVAAEIRHCAAVYEKLKVERKARERYSQ